MTSILLQIFCWIKKAKEFFENRQTFLKVMNGKYRWFFWLTVQLMWVSSSVNYCSVICPWSLRFIWRRIVDASASSWFRTLVTTSQQNWHWRSSRLNYWNTVLVGLSVLSLATRSVYTRCPSVVLTATYIIYQWQFVISSWVQTVSSSPRSLAISSRT